MSGTRTVCLPRLSRGARKTLPSPRWLPIASLPCLPYSQLYPYASPYLPAPMGEPIKQGNSLGLAVVSCHPIDATLDRGSPWSWLPLRRIGLGPEMARNDYFCPSWRANEKPARDWLSP